MRDDGGKNSAEDNSFVEIALADDEQVGDDLTKTPGDTADEVTNDSSRPVTALRRHYDGAGANSRLSHKSWEAYNHQEEMTQASHTMAKTHIVPTLPATTTGPESIDLPDSLNDFEGEEYQSPNLYREDSLGPPQPKLLQLESHQDVDSLQFQVSTNKVSQSPLDSLIEINSGGGKTKINAAEFFDSITSINKNSTNANDAFCSARRRIIPYCDNSLSSGTSAFTSQDVSFDSKDSSSSPSDVERTRQVLTINNLKSL